MAPIRSDRNQKPYSRPRNSDGPWLHDRAPLSSLAAAIPTSANTKLVVSNLHYEITPKDLVSIFGQIGTLVREPLIRYDRSGRSSGVAYVSFETSTEAIRAKKQFHGMAAKGQSMEIAFDTAAPPRRPRSVSMPGSKTSSLLNRIERPSLAERLGSGGEKQQQGGFSLGPIRTRARARPSAPKASAPKVAPAAKTKARTKPKTAEELDQELDAFMGDGTPDVNVGGADEKGAEAVEDVEMV
ncbi:hypothetical protein SERLA73DRAFT_175356 [Serpula lacrymans var. lacrymans S7.3]|uniref:RRM domain-containing protein n=2 Tax=Serpula lacrymans var. lacrymans TaxID=341189 RepID=F8PJB3_SERL3|nr:uncharacterized protein SERLADRAFT_457577 [Serpula lacrymans var. lacrymans S7.9]EGO03738.1 hypothetical protein SERLA73DRAFT_175356 [Serpula lacrymans var. lacrymans S7.3]EGO29605.1 hypothetical protein SERLADRAFT_457577 [Serpula lacrymans var. lacrymans S7.9]